jgi:phosphoribosylanthranilate isomerase
MESPSLPRVKICGLTRADEALACVELGVAAIGCVFFPKSPRNVSEEQARSICRDLPPQICSVGVFVNESFSTIMGKVERCGLKAVQLHGMESEDLVKRLLKEGVRVIKALFINGTPGLDGAGSYSASAFLVECAGGPLPGGNAKTWDWSVATSLCSRFPVVLAGGLTPENVGEAIRTALPAALDVSSGVESSPGRKDIDKVKRFLEAVGKSQCITKGRRVF